MLSNLKRLSKQLIHLYIVLVNRNKTLSCHSTWKKETEFIQKVNTGTSFYFSNTAC